MTVRKILSWIFYLLPFKRYQYRLCYLLKVPFPEAVVKRNIQQRLTKNIGIKADWENPKRFSEKLQYYKFHYRNPRMTQLADKYRVREYLEELGCSHLLVKLYAVADRYEDIDFSALPKSFVIKVNHDSGGVFIIKDKDTHDFTGMKKKINRLLKYPYIRGINLGEWSYLNIEPKIIIEEYLEDESGSLRDYKVHCFHGEPQYIQVDSDRFENHTRAFYDLEWNRCQFGLGFKRSDERVAPPAQLKEMIELSRKLSNDFPYVRMDYYCANEKLYFGEFTFFHGSGIEAFDPDQCDYEWGNLIDISQMKASS